MQDKYIIKRKKGQHLRLNERWKIWALLKQGKTKKFIAKEIGISERTLYYEIKRGIVKGLKRSDLTEYDEYSPEKADNTYLNNKKNKQGSLKIGNNIEFAMFIESMIINEKNSPYAALEKAKKAGFKLDICLRTLYNYIHNEIFLNLTPNNLPYKKSNKKYKTRDKSIRKLGGTSIEERSEVINNREEIGHWEMDTVVSGKGYKSCLLVLTERYSRKEIIIKLKDKTSDSVIKALTRLKNKFKTTFSKRFKTITVDNGSEFMNAKGIEDLGVLNVYYAHSYCSYERGSNENANRLIRRFIPKGADIGKISYQSIKKIENFINDYPRVMFDGKSSNEIYASELLKLGKL